MQDTSEPCKCLESEDKRLILKIIDETIDRENAELKNIVLKRQRMAPRPPFVESFIGIRSSLVRVHQEFKKDIENLKKRVEQYPKCGTKLKQPAPEIGINVRIPEGSMPVLYSQRKIF